jgi:hypothetical protein
LSDWKLFLAFLEPLCEKEWVVYAKAPFRGPDHLFAHLPPALASHYLSAFRPSRKRSISAPETSHLFSQTEGENGQLLP